MSPAWSGIVQCWGMVNVADMKLSKMVLLIAIHEQILGWSRSDYRRAEMKYLAIKRGLKTDQKWSKWLKTCTKLKDGDVLRNVQNGRGMGMSERTMYEEFEIWIHRSLLTLKAQWKCRWCPGATLSPLFDHRAIKDHLLKGPITEFPLIRLIWSVSGFLKKEKMIIA